MSMRSYGKIVVALGLVLVLAGTSQAQRQGRGRGQGGVGGGELVNNESVQKELKLSADQITKVKDAIKEVQAKHKDDLAKLRDLQGDENRAQRAEIMKGVRADLKKAIAEVLTPEQQKRLHEIELQQAGARAFEQEDVQKELKLTDDQKEKIKTINADAAKARQELSQGGQRPDREKIQSLRKETNTKIMEVLTDQQKETWKKMTGAPFEIQRRQRNNQ
jgi:Spy/CpxP family protein refolding chaperone